MTTKTAIQTFRLHTGEVGVPLALLDAFAQPSSGRFICHFGNPIPSRRTLFKRFATRRAAERFRSLVLGLPYGWEADEIEVA